MQNQCDEIKIRAEEKAEKMLGEQKKNPGVRMVGSNNLSSSDITISISLV